MYTRRQATIQILALSALQAGGGSVAHAEPRTLRLNTLTPVNAPHFGGVLEVFRQTIETRSGGQLTIDVRGFDPLNPPATNFPALERGELDLTQTVQGYHPGRFPRSSVVDLPLLFDTAAVGGKVLTTLFQEGLLEKEYESVKVLALNTMPPASIFTTGRKITSAKDFRGLRVRTPSATAGRALALLGAIPIGVPFDMLGESLTNGTLDAVMYYMDSTLVTPVSGGKMLSDLLTVAVDIHFAATALMLVMNRASWEALPEDLRAVVDAAGLEFAANDARVRDATEDVARAKFRADSRYTYIEFTPEHAAELRRAVGPAYEDWKATMGKAGIDGGRLLTRAGELIQRFAVAGN
jgi:TRAP-type C4-dicarboxylate transport system substrate-binding protein